MKITGNKEKYCDRDSIPSEKYAAGGPEGPGADPPALLEKNTPASAACLQAMEPWELESRLKINPQLAMKAFADFQEFGAPGGESPPLLSYHGLAYQNLDAESLAWRISPLRGSIRILSAFYGV